MDETVLRDLIELVTHRYFGKYRGQVVNTDDPTQRGRLQVRVPAVLGDLAVWAMPCVPYAGDGVGFYALPPVDAGVWVEFEGGDPSYPIWVGCFWADGQLPDASDQQVKIWKTAQLSVRLDDANDEMVLQSGSDARITISDKVVHAAGGASHAIESSAITSDAGGVGKVEVSGSSVNINSGALEVT